MYSKQEDKYISIIESCYKTCPRTQNLHNDYSGYTVNECVKDILEKIKEVTNPVFYSVKDNDKLIGYFITASTEEKGMDCLFSFFIKPDYRNKKVLTEYWNIINNKFNGDFISGVYSSNKPAIRFLKRNSKKEITMENYTAFLFSKEKICL